jgi:hypothetical protein
MFGSPATLGDLRRRFEAAQQAGRAERPGAFEAFVARQAALALEIAEWGQIGRRYKVPRFVGEELRSSPRFIADLEELARESGRPVEELERTADQYMKELVAVPSASFIDLRAMFDNFVLSLGYKKGVVCRDEDLEWLRRIVQTRPTMLLWTHKTYIDSVALTAKLYEKDFPMLHIFAGINVGFAGMGTLMRRSGGIFIRRSFQDQPLYKIVLRHYIGYLMEKRGNTLPHRQADAAALRPAQVRAGSGPGDGCPRYPRHSGGGQLRPDARRGGIRQRADRTGQEARVPEMADRLPVEPAPADGPDVSGFRRAGGAARGARPG